MKTDSLFYRLFQEYPEVVFEPAEWPLPADAGYILQAEEVKQTSFRLDGVLTPAGADPALPLVFVEAQFQRKTFYPCWFSELFLYLYRRNIERPWRAVVIFPNRAAEMEPSPAYRVLFDLPWVQRVYLENFADRPVATPGLQLIQLIVAEPANGIFTHQPLKAAVLLGRDCESMLINWLIGFASRVEDACLAHFTLTRTGLFTVVTCQSPGWPVLLYRRASGWDSRFRYRAFYPSSYPTR